MEKDTKTLKKVLITGGSSGLGRELVHEFVCQNYMVHILDKKRQSNDIPSGAVMQPVFYNVDLSNLEEVKDFILEQNKVGVQYEIVVLNAAPRIFKYFHDYTPDEIIEQTNASYVGSLLLLNFALKGMTGKSWGRIVVISSKSGIMGYSTGSLYCSFKSAWISFHESVSRELKRHKNVGLLTLCPDSFSKNNGEKLNRYDVVIKRIKKKIFKFIQTGNSQLYFPLVFSSRITLVLQILKKLKNLFR